MFLFLATVFVIVRKYKSDSHVFCLSVSQSSINICSPRSGSWDTIHPLHLHFNQSINQSIMQSNNQSINNRYLPTQAVGIVSVFFICTSILTFCLKTHPDMRVPIIHNLTVRVSEKTVKVNLVWNLSGKHVPYFSFYKRKQKGKFPQIGAGTSDTPGQTLRELSSKWSFQTSESVPNRIKSWVLTSSHFIYVQGLAFS